MKLRSYLIMLENKADSQLHIPELDLPSQEKEKMYHVSHQSPLASSLFLIGRNILSQTLGRSILIRSSPRSESIWTLERGKNYQNLEFSATISRFTGMLQGQKPRHGHNASCYTLPEGDIC